MSSAPARLPFLTAFAVCLCALLAAWALQTWAYLVPCTLCYTQRGVFVLAGGVCLLGALRHWQRCGRRVLAALAGLCAVFGGALSLRQLWLQYHLDPVHALDFLNAENRTRALNLRDVLKAYVVGSPDCGLVNWSLLGMSLPEWSLLAFCMVLCVVLFPLLRR